MGGRFRVIVISERCKGCGICIEFCPRNVLEFGSNLSPRGYRYPVPVREEECIGCGQCEIYCPDFAIYIKTVD